MSKLVANQWTIRGKNCKLILLFSLLFIDGFEAKIDFDHKLCGDNNCNAPIGFGKTTVMYMKSDDHLLSFPAHAQVIIFGKTQDDKLYDVEINGKRGFAPKNLILEERMVNKNPHIIVKINQNEENTNSEQNVNIGGNSDINNSDNRDERKISDNNIEDSIKSTNDSTLESVLTNKSLENNITDANTNAIPVAIQNNDNFDNKDEPNILSDNTNESGIQLTEDSNLESVLANNTPENNITATNTNAIPDGIQNNENLDNKVEPKLLSDNNIESNQSTNDSILESVLTNISSENNNTDTNTNAIPDGIQNNENSDNKYEPKILSDNTIENSIQSTNDSNLDTVLANNSLENNIMATNTNAIPDGIQNNENLDNKDEPKIFDNTIESSVQSTKGSILESVLFNSSSENIITATNTNDIPVGIQNSENFDIKDESKILSDNTVESSVQSTNDSNLESVLSNISSENINTGANTNEIPVEIQNYENIDIKDDPKILTENTIERSIQSTNDSNLESVLSNISSENNITATNSNAIPVGILNNENIDNIAVKIEAIERQSSDTNTFSLTFFLQQYINIIKIYTDVISDILPDDIKLMLKQFNISSHLVVFTSIIAFNWCMLKLIISIRFSTKKETDLREIGCKAQRQAYYFEAEKVKLHEEVAKEREKAMLAEEALQKIEHKVFPMEMEIKKLKVERDQLQQRVVSLESELESATEAGFELNKLLNDFLTSQKENVNLNSSVDALQQQITKQAEIVSLYQSSAKQKEKENYELKERCEKLTVEVDRLKNVLKDTENNFEIIQFNNEDLKAAKSELLAKFNELQEDYSNNSRELTEYTLKHDKLLVEIQQFNDRVDGLTIEIGNRDKEIETLNEIIAKFYSQRNGDVNLSDEGIIDSLNDLYNAVKIQSQLRNAESERNDLSIKYNDLKLECKQLNEKLIELDKSNHRLSDERETAVQEKVKAQMELEVLSRYYKEKELELGKQIGVQHVQRMQKEDDASSLAAQLAALEEENHSYKTQFLSMKKEVAETDRRFKSQISQLEKQAHENWILARNAERKLEEAKAEAAVLRQTLTMNVKSPVDGYVGDNSYLDDSASSVSSMHEHFLGAFPPPPPPPPPPPMSMYSSFNGYLPSMNMPFEENDASYGAWNSSIGSQPQMHTNFMPIQNEMLASNNGVSYSSTQLPLSYVGSVQQQWDASSTRDTYSPASHRSNDQNSRVNSPHPSFNAYPQTMMSGNQSHYQRNSTMTSIDSPYSNSVNANDYSYTGSAYNSFSSPVSNSVSHTTTSVLSNPIPSHWTKPNGNLIQNNVNSRESNETDSRPTSRISDNSLHTSIV